MDPFSAIGLASNIIAFIDFGAKIIKAAKEIHGSASGASSNNEELENLTKSMEALSLDLKPSKSPSDMSVSERDLLGVCTECESLTADLLKVLNGIKSRRPGSKLSSTSAAIRSFKNQRHTKELESKLEKCRAIFQIQLERVTRNELGQKLDDIVKTGNINESEMRSLRKNTDMLRGGIAVTSLEPKAVEQLRLLLAQSDEAIEKAGQDLILERLRDKNMGVRFFDIPKAHSQTLSWIFDGVDESWIVQSPYSYSSRVPTQSLIAMQKARDDYMFWLKRSPSNKEMAIFHVSGKPGAGKSTMMKYLRKHKATLDGLREWAGGKTLVICHYFAWRPGNAVQNTIRGLLTTILYGILREAPELCQLAFEGQWHKIKADHFVDGTPEEIKLGLDAILKNKNTFNTHRFCIFIDGLDEFREDPNDLVRQILDWAILGGSDIKLCVSSREWLVFQQRFERCPRITLQDINRRDISLRVQHGLESIEELETREDRAMILALGRDLTEKSEGVFLWAKLALSTVQESVLSDESAKDIARKIDSLPRELEETFQHIFDSMRNHRYEIDRRRSMITLRLVLEYPESIRGWGAAGFPLTYYSFLDEYDDDHQFVQKRPIEHWSEEEIRSRDVRARKQILRRCFGLVEVTGHQKLKFLHRAVSEFMARGRTSRDINVLTADFNMLEFTRQSFLAKTKFMSYPSDYFSVSRYGSLSLYWIDPSSERRCYIFGTDRLADNLSPNQTHIRIPLSTFQRELLEVLDLSNMLPYSNQHTIAEPFIHDVVENCLTKSRAGKFPVSYGTPEITSKKEYSEACGIADAVLLTICSSGSFELVPPATLLSRRQFHGSELPNSTLLPGVDLEPLLWYTLSNLGSHAPEQRTFNILDYLLMERCQHTTNSSEDEMWKPPYWPGLWRRLVWSGFWSAYSDSPKDYVAPLEPLLRIFLLYGAPPNLSFRITRYLREKRAHWMVNSLDPPQHANMSRLIRAEPNYSNSPYVLRRPWPRPEYAGKNHVIVRRGKLPNKLEAHLLQNRDAEAVFSLHELVALWFPPHRAKALQYLMEQTLRRGGPPTREEVLEMKANRNLDVDIQNGITYESVPIPEWGFDLDHRTDSDWEDWGKDAYCGDDPDWEDWGKDAYCGDDRAVLC